MKRSNLAFLVAALAIPVILPGCTPQRVYGSDTPQLKSENATDPVQMLKIADVARQSQDYQSSSRMYHRIIEAGLDRYDTRFGLGVSLAGIGDLKGAEHELHKAIVDDPAKSEAQFALGRVYVGLRKPNEALAAFDAGLALSPDAATGWNGKGVALDILQRHDEAQEAYRTGLAKAPDDKSLRNNYGLSLALSGNYAEAKKILTDLVEEPGATTRNRQNLALTLGLSGDDDDAKVVSKADLDDAAVANNLKFYDAARQGFANGQQSGAAQ